MNSTHARRWAAEAVVIVGSILLAFALDAWWDDRREFDRVIGLLDAVEDEFAREITGLDSIIAVNRREVARGRVLLELSDPARGTPAPDAVAALVAVDETFEIYDPSFGALAAILSTGALERVEDPGIRSRLGGWSAELVDLDWERGMMDDAVAGLFGSFEDRGAMSSLVDVGDWWPVRLEASMRSPIHRERESRFAFVTSLYTDDLVRIRRRADEVRVALSAYLESTR